MSKRVLLAGDIGATKTNLALFADVAGGIELLAEETLLNRDHTGLEEIAGGFVTRKGHAPEAACFGVAGPVNEGRSHLPNLRWTIDGESLARALGLERVVVLNDLEATAYGIDTLPSDRFAVLNPGIPGRKANRAIIAAGTGLGEAIAWWDGSCHRVAPSEGGHADYAPCDPEQIRILERLAKRFGHVSTERLVSGPGLHNIYEALDEREDPAVAERIQGAGDPSAVISELALAGSSRRCVQALDVFARAYGAEAGNLALTALASGGVFVGGGIAPKILRKLEDGGFVRAFCDKGRMSDLLRSIPVKVILDPKTALRGAAAHLAATRP